VVGTGVQGEAHVRALQRDPPERLPKKLRALTTMKLVHEIIEVTRRRLLVAFQAQQRSDIFFVELVHEGGV